MTDGGQRLSVRVIRIFGLAMLTLGLAAFLDGVRTFTSDVTLSETFAVIATMLAIAGAGFAVGLLVLAVNSRRTR